MRGRTRGDIEEEELKLFKIEKKVSKSACPRRNRWR